jgi:hypothetical protein
MLRNAVNPDAFWAVPCRLDFRSEVLAIRAARQHEDAYVVRF